MVRRATMVQWLWPNCLLSGSFGVSLEEGQKGHLPNCSLPSSPGRVRPLPHRNDPGKGSCIMGGELCSHWQTDLLCAIPTWNWWVWRHRDAFAIHAWKALGSKSQLEYFWPHWDASQPIILHDDGPKQKLFRPAATRGEYVLRADWGTPQLWHCLTRSEPTCCEHGVPSPANCGTLPATLWNCCAGSQPPSPKDHKPWESCDRGTSPPNRTPRRPWKSGAEYLAWAEVLHSMTPEPASTTRDLVDIPLWSSLATPMMFLLPIAEKRCAKEALLERLRESCWCICRLFWPKLLQPLNLWAKLDWSGHARDKFWPAGPVTKGPDIL